MDIWQGGRQLASIFAAALWADPPTSAVLTTAVVSEDSDGNLLIGNPARTTASSERDLTPPFARIQCVGAELDPDSPGRYSVVVYRIHVTAGSGGIAGTPDSSPPNDSHGISQETGALRSSSQGQGKSQGRSTDEIVGRLLESLGIANLPGHLIDSVHGMQGMATLLTERANVDGSQILKRTIEVEVYNATASRYYHPVFIPAKPTSTVSGRIDATWSNGPTRYDFLRTIVRRSGAGGSAPTSPTGADGSTAVTVTGGNSGVAATITGLTSGQTYSLTYWHAFNEAGTTDGSGNLLEERYSDPVSRSVVVA